MTTNFMRKEKESKWIGRWCFAIPVEDVKRIRDVEELIGVGKICHYSRRWKPAHNDVLGKNHPRYPNTMTE